MPPTDYPEINHLLDVLLASLQDVLGDNLVGLYLYGSLVWGDFDIEISDIDLLAALERDLTDVEATAIKHMHDTIAARFSTWDNRIEVQYYSKLGLKTFKTQSRPMGNISPGEPFHMITAGPDWLMNWYFVQEHGLTLFGPPPATLIDRVTLDEFVQRARDDTVEWRNRMTRIQNVPGQSYAIMTMCRALYTIRFRQHVSKLKAVEWAASEFPEWAPLIKNAFIWRKNPDYGTANLEESTQLVNFLIDQVG